jgi:hypothetical protein
VNPESFIGKRFQTTFSAQRVSPFPKLAIVDVIGVALIGLLGRPARCQAH